MTKPTKTKIEKALKEFDLISGPGTQRSGKACAMTLLCWINGDDWTDSPECAHRLLTGLAIDANDGTQDQEERKRIVRAGATGILDTWWVPDTVVAWALASVPKDGTDVDRVVAVSEFIARWKADKARPNLSRANLYGANLSRADLYGADLSRANLSRANLSGADLSRANLSGADLSRANLSRAENVVLPSKWVKQSSGLVVPK